MADACLGNWFGDGPAASASGTADAAAGTIFAGEVVAALRDRSNPAVVLPVHRLTEAVSSTLCAPGDGEFGMGHSVPVQCFKLQSEHLAHVGDFGRTLRFFVAGGLVRPVLLSEVRTVGFVAVDCSRLLLHQPE
jgi:hypothetical protein